MVRGDVPSGVKACWWAGFPLELRLLIRLLSAGIDGRSHQVEGSDFGGIDWGGFMELVVYHRVVRDVLRGDALDPVLPIEVREFLHHQYGHQQLHQMLLIGSLAKIEVLFRRKGIGFILLKGPAISQQLYGNPLSRHFRDIDLLVRRDDVFPALELLSECGFVLSEKGHSLELQEFERILRFGHHFTLVDSRGCWVELHWRLDQSGGWVTFQELLPRSAFVDIGGRRYSTPGLADLCLFLFSHGSRHLWFRLKWLVDLALYLNRYPSLDDPHGFNNSVSVRLGKRMLGNLNFHHCRQERGLRFRLGFLEYTCLAGLKAGTRGCAGSLKNRISVVLLTGGLSLTLDDLLYFSIPFRLILSVRLPRPLWFLYYPLIPFYLIGKSWKSMSKHFLR